MKRNNFEANTPDRIPTNGFRTPVNPRPPIWSPILEATTPDLNGPNSGVKGTPALIRSLEINPELDVSWSSAMATPTGLFLPGIKEFTTPDILDEKSKNLQRRHLFHNDLSDKNKGDSCLPIQEKKEKLCCENEDVTANFLGNGPIKDELKPADLISLFKKPAIQFIYPEPIFIDLHGKTRTLNSIKILRQQPFGARLEKDSVPGPAITKQQQRNSRESRKSLNFSSETVSENSCDSLDNSSSQSATHQEYDVLNDEPTLKKFKSHPHDETSCSNSSFGNDLLQGKPINICEEFTRSSKCKVRLNCVTSSDDNHKYFDTVDPQPVTGSIGFKTANGKQVPISEKALHKAKAMLEEIEVADLLPIKAEHFSSRQNIYKVEHPVPEKNSNSDQVLQKISNFAKVQRTIGFSTANGKQVPISEKAMIKAKAMLEEIEVADPPIKEEGIPSKFKITIENPVFENTHVSGKAQQPNLNSAAIPKIKGFSTARGKPVIISKEAAAKAQAMFDEVCEPLPSDPSPKTFGFSTASGKKVALSEKGIAKAKSLLAEFEEDLPKEVPQTVGFSTASGKSVVVSEKAMLQAQTLLEDIGEKSASVDEEILTTKIISAEKSLPISKQMRTNPSKCGNGSFRVPQSTNGFNSAKGEKIYVSEEAMKRRQNIFTDEEHLPEALANPSRNGFNTASGKHVHISEKTLSKAAQLFNEIEDKDFTFAEAPNTVRFITVSGKNIKMSESALSRGRKLFDEITKNEDPPQALIKSSEPDIRSSLAVKYENTEMKVTVEEKDDEDERWVSSPTIGKRKRKHPSPSPRTNLPLTPVSGTPSAFDNLLISVPIKVLVMRRKARQEQELAIKSKQLKGRKPLAKPGYLFQLKKNETRQKKTWKELIGDSKLPEVCARYQLLQDHGVLPSVCLVEASNALSFTFLAWEHFPNEDYQKNSEGLQIGEFVVILSDDNTISCEEIIHSLLASKNVDPALCSPEWIRNHFRWIVWKLASMELRCPTLFARTCLTPVNVLEQLKYRYDREIDNCQRSALRRVIEQDDTPAKMMILCVAEIRDKKILELTDGWYSIDAHCDQAMQQLIEKNKIFVGVKLVISGAELVSPGPSAPLEKGADTYLKISTNSTRRARWDSKLGFFSNPLPFPISLSSVLPEGGIVSHVRVSIVRVYPLMYMEKTADGKAVFHSERQYRRISESAAMRYERMMEKLVEDIEREEDEQERKRTRAEGSRHKNVNLSDEERRCKVLTEAQKRMQANMKSFEGVPILKLRVVDWRATNINSAIVSIWRPCEELQHHLKEGRTYHLYNVNATGIRLGELQLNAMKHTSWIEIKNHIPISQSQGLIQSVTSFSTANQQGFKPMFNEIDIVGLVVFVGQRQNKGPFQTVVLSDGTNYFGIKCWATLEDYALADIIVVGTFLAFSNLQWRPTALRTTSKLQFAFIHEGTLVSSRPAQKHLDVALQNLKQSVSDPASCVTEAEEQVNIMLGSTTPQSATPKYGIQAGRMFTPNGFCSGEVKKEDTPTSSNNVAVSRARLLEKYGAPPALSPWSTSASPHVRQKFKPPARKPPAV